MIRTAALTVLLAAASPAAQADARCNCTQKLGTCEARVKLEANRLLVSSSAPQCSMVVFHVDGQPKVTTVLDGISSEEWLGPSPSPQLSIDSCTVCADRNHPVSAAPAPAPGPAESAFLGRWTATGRCSWGSSSYAFTIADVTGGDVKASGRFGNCSFDEGRVSGSSISMTCSNWLNTVRYRGRLVSPTRIEGTYTQSTSGETCSWQANKQ
jgi:hypothetical protein